MKILHVDSSVLGVQSATRALSAAAVARLTAANPGSEVIHLDLDSEPLPHLTSGSLAGKDPAEAARATRILDDFLAADVIVLGVPMYNFGIPSTLKAWIDRITVAGRSFRYTAEGPVGLAAGKRVLIAAARGGVYPAGSPADHVEPYLAFVFNFLGITDLTMLRAEGLALSPERRVAALAAATAQLEGTLALAH